MTENTPPVQEAAFFRTIREWGLVRGSDGVVGGVASGVGARVGLAPVPSRLILVAAAFLLFPLLLIAYAAAWGLLPDKQGNIIIQNFGRGVTNVGALVGIAALFIVGIASFDRPRGYLPFFSIDPFGVDIPTVGLAIGLLAIPLAIIAAVITLVVVLSRKGRNNPPGPDAVYAATPEQTRSAASAVPLAEATTAYTTAPPPPPRVPGPGSGFYLLTLAWAVISIAGTAWAHREGMLAIWAPVAWGLAFLTGLGVILILVSLSGRKVGFLGFLGGLGMIPGLILVVASGPIISDFENNAFDFELIIGEAVPETGNESINAAAELSEHYGDVFLNGICQTAPTEVYEVIGSSVAHFNRAELGAPESLETSAEVTYVTVGEGSGLSLTSGAEATATVVFENFGLECETSGATHLTIGDPNAPALNIQATSEYDHFYVIIKEN